jgi:hypothetical protein
MANAAAARRPAAVSRATAVMVRYVTMASVLLALPRAALPMTVEMG